MNLRLLDQQGNAQAIRLLLPHTYTRTHTRMHTHTHTHMHAHTHTQHTHSHAHIHTRVHTHNTHTQNIVVHIITCIAGDGVSGVLLIISVFICMFLWYVTNNLLTTKTILVYKRM